MLIFNKERIVISENIIDEPLLVNQAAFAFDDSSCPNNNYVGNMGSFMIQCCPKHQKYLLTFSPLKYESHEDADEHY